MPGIQGVVGPGWLSTTGFQVRQHRVSPYGGRDTVTALDAMGSHAPTWGVTAEAVNAREEAVDSPHTIEMDNFELPLAYGGTHQFGVDPTSPSYFDDNADPQETDQSGVVIKPNYTGQ